MSDALDRLDAMVADGQRTWDLSPNDVAALRVARDALALVESAEGARPLPVEFERWMHNTRTGIGELEAVVQGRVVVSGVTEAEGEKQARERMAARLVATALRLRGAT